MVVACTYNLTLRRLRQDFCKFAVKLATQQVTGQYNLQSKALSLKTARSKGDGEARTATEVTKDVVALLGECDFVDSMADETGFQQVAGILAGLPPVCESFHVVVQPVHHV